MKRPVLALTAVALAALAIYAGYRAHASDETKIRWLLEDAADSFNDASVRGCLAAFHPDYKERSNRYLDKSTLGRGLLYLFQKHRDTETDRFLYRVRLPEDSRTILVEEDGEAVATFDLHLEIQKHADSDWRETWRVRVTARLRKSDDEWLIRESSVKTISGSRPR